MRTERRFRLALAMLTALMGCGDEQGRQALDASQGDRQDLRLPDGAADLAPPPDLGPWEPPPSLPACAEPIPGNVSTIVSPQGALAPLDMAPLRDGAMLLYAEAEGQSHRIRLQRLTEGGSLVGEPIEVGRVATGPGETVALSLAADEQRILVCHAAVPDEGPWPDILCITLPLDSRDIQSGGTIPGASWPALAWGPTGFVLAYRTEDGLMVQPLDPQAQPQGISRQVDDAEGGPVTIAPAPWGYAVASPNPRREPILYRLGLDLSRQGSALSLSPGDYCKKHVALSSTDDLVGAAWIDVRGEAMAVVLGPDGPPSAPAALSEGANSYGDLDIVGSGGSFAVTWSDLLGFIGYRALSPKGNPLESPLTAHLVDWDDNPHALTLTSQGFLLASTYGLLQDALHIIPLNCSGCLPTDEADEEACIDGLDNDCDNKTDCADQDCTCALACGGTGCAPCQLGPESSEEACNDGCSNDGDPDVDCADQDCACTLTCGGVGCSCQLGPESSEEACNDGCSNDGDPDVDCADQDCACTQVCGGIGCNCQLGPESSERACNDGCSNDGDPDVDCADQDCACTLICGGTGCAPCIEGPESSEEACNDGCSNDRDSYIDCDDWDCDCALACGGTGCITCIEGPESSEEACSDGCSNDGDPYIDCDDWDCEATQACWIPSEDSDVLCADGLDNDNDGHIDCQDPDCAAVGGCENNDVSCADGQDNDNDGLTDCADEDCYRNFSVSVCPATVRVATWNIHTVGDPSTMEYQAALAVIKRLGADVVGLNEINGSTDMPNLAILANEAGYDFSLVSDATSFGSLRNGFLSRLPVLEQTLNTSEALSGDPKANDMTRQALELLLDLPGTSRDLTVVVEHWKSGSADTDEFRRVCDSYRVAGTVADRDGANDGYVIMGDVNELMEDVPQSPNPFVALPSGLPSSFTLGSDLEGELLGQGIPNDPFHYILRATSPGPVLLEAYQLDGSNATRPASGRRIDYIFLSQALMDQGPRAEVYDSQDEGLAGGLPKVGEPLADNTCSDASDHLPVLVDLTVAP